MAVAASGAGSQAPDPHDVADTIARVIALPAGSRPLRTVVAIDNQRDGPAALNDVSDRVRAATMEALGVTASAPPRVAAVP